MAEDASPPEWLLALIVFAAAGLGYLPVLRTHRFAVLVAEKSRGIRDQCSPPPDPPANLDFDWRHALRTETFQSLTDVEEIQEKRDKTRTKAVCAGIAASVLNTVLNLMQLSADPTRTVIAFLVRLALATPAVWASVGCKDIGYCLKRLCFRRCCPEDADPPLSFLAILRMMGFWIVLTCFSFFTLMYMPYVHAAWAPYWHILHQGRSWMPFCEPEYHIMLRDSLLCIGLVEGIIDVLYTMPHVTAFSVLKVVADAGMVIAGLVLLICASWASEPDRLRVFAGGGDRRYAADMDDLGRFNQAWEGDYTHQSRRMNGAPVWELRSRSYADVFLLISSPSGVWCIIRAVDEETFSEDDALARFEFFHLGVQPHRLRAAYKAVWSIREHEGWRFVPQSDVTVYDPEFGGDLDEPPRWRIQGDKAPSRNQPLPPRGLPVPVYPRRLEVKNSMNDMGGMDQLANGANLYGITGIHCGASMYGMTMPGEFDGVYDRHGSHNAQPFWRMNSGNQTRFIFAGTKKKWDEKERFLISQGEYTDTAPDETTQRVVYESDDGIGDMVGGKWVKSPHDVILWRRVQGDRISYDRWIKVANVGRHSLGGRWTVRDVMYGRFGFGDEQRDSIAQPEPIHRPSFWRRMSPRDSIEAKRLKEEKKQAKIKAAKERKEERLEAAKARKAAKVEERARQKAMNKQQPDLPLADSSSRGRGDAPLRAPARQRPVV